MTMEKLIIFVVLANLALVLTETAPVVQIHDGKIQGRVLAVGTNGSVNFFQGIRYGRAVRYQKPKPVEPWTNVYEATNEQFVCPQFGSLGALLNGNHNESEDCLFLNVWQPSAAVGSENPLPVMAFIHGGAFEMGSYNMDGKDLAHQGQVIVVTMNYRLGALGFMAGGDIPANLGLHDQLLALRWVQTNAKFFGGNADQVTIFGESAGSISVGSLVLSPLAKGLFRRAILQSGSPAVDVLGASKQRMEEKTKALAGKLHCPNDKIEEAVKCIKNATIDQIKQASLNDFVENNFFVPMYGDEVMPIQPAQALKTGKFNQNIDVMYGVTRDEGSLFAFLLVPDIMQNDEMNVKTVREDIVKIMKKYKVAHEEEVADYYIGQLHNATQDEMKKTISDVFGDYALLCPTILFGEELAKHMPNNHFYSYRLIEFYQSFFPKWMGVTHGSDLTYIFSVEQTKSDPKLAQLSRDIIHAWAAFAKTGSPGKLSGVEWEAAGPVAKHITLDGGGHYRMISDFYKQKCDTFWKPKMF